MTAAAAGPAPERGRVTRWMFSRAPRQDTQLLTQRNVYILPSKAGCMLAAVLLVLLVASINFQLNLGYLLTFLLGGSALAAMHVGHGTLRGATLHLLPPAPVFAGDAAVLEVEIADEGLRPRPGIAASLRGSDERAFIDVPAGGRASVHIAWTPPRRGVHELPPIEVETRFPIGAFRAWTVWRPATDLVVFPRPEVPAPPLPPGAPREGSALAASLVASGGAEPEGVRTYRRGDPLRQVVWKKSARAIAAGSGELTSRDTAQPSESDLWFDLHNTGAFSLEDRLSRICAWVLQAEQLEQPYGLRLPGVEIAPDHGAGHRHRCLEALARC
ncbi:DUF58 domain-containing protein [Xylophilus sp. GOD-11R]|uniref:DUF58 domain-containing protein n=1 Tax=Xylophilus sp. GOD-11R TaxID=3089814 RepID=UPI00298C9F64|nr:DUF58 domain-containing protein [Xylophilus sp. GOD-11R]WPB59103.1 DUF58 domain-containing protein [Xylophilus sp. GOD-11R]